jgi:hypothetical protein
VTSADGNGLALEARVVALLHGRVKGVHVDVNDLAKGTIGICHGTPVCPREGLRV